MKEETKFNLAIAITLVLVVLTVIWMFHTMSQIK